MIKRILPLLTYSWPLLLALVAISCGTTGGPASASFASVTITNRTPEQIRVAAAKVFRAEGYEAYQQTPTKWVFEREASRLETISRDGLIAAQSGARTMERVRTELVDLGLGTYRLQSEAFMVSGAGDAFFENEVRKTNMRSGPYRSIMKKIGEELK